MSYFDHPSSQAAQRKLAFGSKMESLPGPEESVVESADFFQHMIKKPMSSMFAHLLFIYITAQFPSPTLGFSLAQLVKALPYEEITTSTKLAFLRK